MKVLLICALVAVASSQFASHPAEVILQRQGNRAILRVPENFQFGDHAIQLIQGGAPGGGAPGSFQQSQQNIHLQAEAARFQQQQQQQQAAAVAAQKQAAAAAAIAAEAARFQQNQSQFQSQQQNQQQGQRAPFQPSTILAGAGQGAQVSSSAEFTRTRQQQQEVRQQTQQQQQQQQEFQAELQANLLLQQQRQTLQQQQQQQEQYDSEVQGVFEPLNLPSGASLLLGQVSTEFSCNNRPYGYYGDDTNNCRVFHICYPALFSSGVIETYQYSFMCGEGTQFDQKEMACVSYEAALPCIETQNYYIRNAEFGLPHEKTK